MWKEPYLVNERGKVMNVSGGSDTENRNIIMYNKHGRINQQWSLIYVDEMPKALGKGDFDPEYGMKIEMDFHIISRLNSKRYLDRVGYDVVIKTPNDRNTQIWYYHYKTRTIRNKYQNYALEIQNAGRSNNVRVYSVNSQWY
jgi:hypothetical protein